MVEPLALAGLWVWSPSRHADSRGWFSEIFSQRALEPQLGGLNFVQENQSYSLRRGVVRGLHFQAPPMAQDKLICVVRGAIVDIALDLRASSATYGQHARVELSAANGTLLFVPKGFAHGFVTLEPDTTVLYKTTNYYSPAHERGVFWLDPVLQIDWGVRAEEAIISEKDSRLPTLAEIPSCFA